MKKGFLLVLVLLVLLMSACGTKEITSNQEKKAADRLTDPEWKPGDKAAVMANTCLVKKEADIEKFVKALQAQDMETLYKMDMEDDSIDCPLGENAIVKIVEIDGKKVKVKANVITGEKPKPETGWLGLSINALAKTFEGKVHSIKEGSIEVKSIEKESKGNIYTIQLTDDTSIIDVNTNLKVAADIAVNDKVRVMFEKASDSNEMLAKEVILPYK